MASYTSTYSGDLSSAVAGYIGSNISAAAQDAHDERNRIEAEILAHNLKHPDRPFDPHFRKTHNILGHEIRGGDFLGSALMHRFTPNPLGLLGERFHKNAFVGQAHLKSQATPFASPVGPFPKPKAAWAAKMAGQPFANIAAGADLKHQIPVQSQTSIANNPITNTVRGREKTHIVHDKKLGEFLSAVAVSLSSSLRNINQKVDASEEGIIAAKDGIAGAVKSLEHDSDTLEGKLDQIIAALREQVSIKEEEQEDTQQLIVESELEDQIKPALPNEFVGLKDSPDDIRMRNEREEMIPDPWGGGDTNINVGGLSGTPNPRANTGMIIDGPNTGYPIAGRPVQGDGQEMIWPLNNDKFKDGTLKAGASFPGRPPRPKEDEIRNFDNAISSKTEVLPTVWGQIGSSLMQEDDTAEDKVKDLQSTMDAYPKAISIVLQQLIGKSIGSIGPLPAYATEEVGKITKSVDSVFGDTPGVSDRIARGVITDLGVEERREKTKASLESERATKREGNWVSNLLGLLNVNVGGRTSYNRTSNIGGGSTNFYRGGGGPINRVTTGLSNWFHRGQTATEATRPFFGKDGMIREDWMMRQRTGGAGKGWWNPFRWLYTMDADKGGLFSGPTPLIRQLLKRSFFAAKSNPVTGLLALIANEFINPQSLADGTLDAHRDIIQSTSNTNNNTNSFKASDMNVLKSIIIERGSRDSEAETLFGSISSLEGTPTITQLSSRDDIDQAAPQSHIDSRVSAGHSGYYADAWPGE